jgi:copper chaperone CopZ
MRHSVRAARAASWHFQVRVGCFKQLRRVKSNGGVNRVTKQTFKVKGMHCPSCEKLLQMDIGDIAGVKSVKADWKKGTVDVEADKMDAGAVKKAISAAGYSPQ